VYATESVVKAPKVALTFSIYPLDLQLTF